MIQQSKNRDILHNLLYDKQVKKDLWQAALNAIDAHDVDKMRSLVLKGLDINSRSPLSGDSNATLLMIAARDANNSEIVKLLLELGADVNAKDLYGNALATAKGYRNIKLLLDYGANLNIPAKIVSVLSEEHPNVIDILLESLLKKAEQNEIDWSKLDWLDLAIEHGDKKLINRLFSIEIKDKEFTSRAFEIALNSSNYELAKKLLRHGAKPDEYAVNEAVLEGDWVRVNFLLKNGGKIIAEDLPEAAIKGNMKAVKFLLKHGANIDEIDGYGCTALLRAVEYGHFDLVKVLLKKGASANIVNSMVNDKTPLMTALWKLHKNQYDDSSAKTYLQIIKTLLKSDADPHLIVEFNDSDGFPYKRSAYELVHMADDYENEVKRLFDKYSKSKKNKWTLLRIFKKQK